MPLDEPLMEGGIGVSRAVGGDKQLRAVEIRCVHGNELDLHRPLGKAALHRGRSSLNA